MIRSAPRGPQGHWFWGCLPEFQAGPLQFFERCRREFGTVATFRLANRRVFLINEPQLIEQVLVTRHRCFKKHFGTRLLKPVLGNGLLLTEGDFWLKQRRLIQPAFSRKLTEKFRDIIRERGSSLVEQWRAEPNRRLHHDMTKLTTQIAAEALLGAELPDDLEAIEAAMEVTHVDYESRLLAAVHIPRWLPITRQIREFRRAVKTLLGVVDRIITNRMRNPGEGTDALSLMLNCEDESGRRMSPRQLRDEALTLLLAGQDTTANALTWSLILLAQHPEIADRFAASPADSEMALHIFLEAMRLYPPVPVFGRQCIESCTIGDFEVKPGDTVLMSQWLMHRDGRFFADPERFDPDRWKNDFEKRLPGYAYFPFGGGPRICIGKELSLLEGSQILDLLGRTYRVHLTGDTPPEPWPTVTLRPKHEVPIRCEAR
jgi:cytochrome P450